MSPLKPVAQLGPEDECTVTISSSSDLTEDYIRCEIPFEHRMYSTPCEHYAYHRNRTPAMVKACGCRWCRATLVALVKLKLVH